MKTQFHEWQLTLGNSKISKKLRVTHRMQSNIVANLSYTGHVWIWKKQHNLTGDTSVYREWKKRRHSHSGWTVGEEQKEKKTCERNNIRKLREKSDVFIVHAGIETPPCCCLLLHNTVC